MNADDKVIGIDRKPVPIQFGPPNPLIIDALERLLEDAKSGRLQAIGAGLVFWEADASTSLETEIHTPAGPPRIALFGAVLKLVAHVMRAAGWLSGEN